MGDDGAPTAVVWSARSLEEGLYTQRALWWAPIIAPSRPPLPPRLGAPTRLTPHSPSGGSPRLRSPACAPGGRWVIAVEAIAGRARLVALPLKAGGALSPLYDLEGLSQVGRAAISPRRVRGKDGERGVLVAVPERGEAGSALTVLWVSEGRLGERDLGEASPEALWSAQPVRRLPTAGQPLHPAFSPDGGALVYVRPAGGAYDVFMREIEQRAEVEALKIGEERQLTRLATGALSPSVGGARLAYELLGAQGVGIATLPWPPADLPPLTPLAAQRHAEVDTTSYELEGELGRPEHLTPARPSDAAATPTLPLLPPLSWTPIGGVETGGEGSLLGVMGSWIDLSLRHELSGSLSATERGGAQWSLDYQMTRGLPRLGLGLAQTERWRERGDLRGGVDAPWWERVSSLALSLSAPSGALGGDAQAFAYYRLNRYAPIQLTARPLDPLDPAPRPPLPSWLGALSAGIAWSSERRPPFAPAAEYGGNLTLSGRVYHPALGGDLTRAELYLTGRYSRRLWAHHAVALKGYGAYGRGEAGRPLTFQLGAPPQQALLWESLMGQEAGALFLRGYPSGALQGDALGLLSLSYRLPLLSPFRGAHSLPMFARQLTLAAWADLGYARVGDEAGQRADWRPSAGVELQQTLTAFWRLDVSLRAGWGRGLGQGGVDQVYFFAGPLW